MHRATFRNIPLAGLYVLLDAQVSGDRDLRDVLTEAAQGGVRLFQYRDKQASMADAYTLARALRALSRAHGALLIVNDRCDLALAVDADGVHLGQRDLPIQAARRLLGPDRLIGLSTHRPVEVEQASQAGADYLGFGPIFPTGTKADPEPVVGVSGLETVRRLTALPIFAIGGVTVDCVDTLRLAGADGVGVASAVVRAQDIAGTARCFVRCFEGGDRPARR